MFPYKILQPKRAHISFPDGDLRSLEIWNEAVGEHQLEQLSKWTPGDDGGHEWASAATQVAQMGTKTQNTEDTEADYGNAQAVAERRDYVKCWLCVGLCGELPSGC